MKKRLIAIFFILVALFGVLFWSGSPKYSRLQLFSSKKDNGPAEVVAPVHGHSWGGAPRSPASSKALQNLLEKLSPKNLRDREIHTRSEENQILSLELLIRGVTLEGSDMKAQRRKDGSLELLSGEIPPLPTEVPEFPTPRVQEAISTVSIELKKESLLVRSITKIESSWILIENNKLIPCINVEAWVESDKKSDREKWCVDANSLEVVRRSSLVRKF